MERFEKFNVSNIPEENIPTCHGARAVLIDQESKMAILYDKKYSNYELPGGGVESGEDDVRAMIRECKEETGCDVISLARIARVEEITNEE